MKGRERLVALVLFAAALALPLLAPAQAPPHGQSPPAPAPGQSLAHPVAPLPTIAAGPAPDLDLLFTAQVAGWIEPCG